MSIIPWNTNSFPTDYFTQGNIKYERRFIDVQTMNDGFQQAAISFDTTYFGILYQRDNIGIHCNKECSAGSFFIPFNLYKTKEELILTVSKFVSTLGGEIKDPFPHIRVFVFRYINPAGERFFAIGGTNLFPKHKTIHELSIKTTLNNPISPSSKESWETLIDELNTDPKEVSCCKVEKDDLIGFESRAAFILKESKDVLIMLSRQEGFRAQHISMITNKTHFQEKGKTFKLKSVRLVSEDDLNQCLKWMIESFRKLTGASCVLAQAFYYINDRGSIDTSIICSRPVKKVSKEDED